MRSQGCQRCREKHSRCIIEHGMRRCESCETADEPCLPPPRKRIRLKAVHSVIEQSRSSGQGGREISFVYGGDHVWVDFHTPVQFVHGNDNDEDSSDVQSSVAVDEDEGAPANPVNVHLGSADVVGEPSIVAAVESYAAERTLSFGRGSASGASHFASSPTYLVSPVQQHRTPSSQIQILSPSTSAVLYESKPLWPLNNLAEAELLRHFIDNIGPQLDVTDHVSHFTTTVPQRAAHCPLLFYAIIAAASIHRSRVQGVPDQFYEEYQAKCIRILIRYLDDPEYSPDENFLAAIVVLRKGEEMSDEDRMCHLLGSARVINSVGEVSANGGLGESAAWLVLRQSIYVSLTSNTPLNVNLGCYKRSSVFLGLNDHAWANKIVFLFAETLAYSAKSNGNGAADVEDWHTLQHAATQWYHDKPDTFLPVFETSGEEGALNEHPTAEFRSPFPTISMLQAPHVIGLMYYHLTLILLALSDPINAARRRGLESIRLWRETEQKVRVDLKRCIGLAISNPHVVASNFEASHILYACGHCLNSPAEREAAVNFLRSVRIKLGWGIDHIIEHLERHWAGVQ
ncbi:Fungal specific transcription factor domain-containing protein [Cladophialophora immunda]|nr:Fungal specific transcription factor domain-containing protein [Cladophialophora immunda]